MCSHILLRLDKSVEFVLPRKKVLPFSPSLSSVVNGFTCIYTIVPSITVGWQIRQLLAVADDH